MAHLDNIAARGQEGISGDVPSAGSGTTGFGGREVRVNGICMNTSQVEEKLDEGNILEAESALRDGLSLNFEVGTPLLPLSFCALFVLLVFRCGKDPTLYYKGCRSKLLLGFSTDKIEEPIVEHSDK